MIKKCLMIIVPLLLLSTCGQNDTRTSGTGSIAFSVEWVGGPGRAAPAAGIYRAPIDCAAAGIATVEAFANQGSTPNIVGTGGPWSCDAHGGDIVFSLFGSASQLTVGVFAKNAAGGVVYYGEQGDVTVNQDQTTDIGAITASYVVPEGVTALAGSGQNLISWNTVTSASAYNIYWSTTPGVTPANGTKIAGVTNSPYTHTGITNGTTYYYIVTAIRSGFESAGSSEVNAKPLAGATMPATGAATSITETAATLGGNFNNPPSYTTSAWFEYGTSTAYGNATTPSGAYAQTGPVNNITANLTGLIQNTTYHYRLVTQNTGGTFNGADRTFTTNRTLLTIATTAPYPRVLAIDANNVYWTEHNSAGSSATGYVKMVSKNSGTITTLFSNPTPTTTAPFGIAVDATNVYWTDTAAGTVNQVPKIGGTVIPLVANLNKPQFIAVDSTHVYWTESDGGTVKKAEINTGLTTTLASGLNGPMGIAVDDANIYWTESTGGMVKKISKSDGTVTIIASGLSNPWSIAVDSTSVYWTENVFGWSGMSNSTSSSNAGTIKKAGISGGLMTTLATNQKNPQGIAVYADSVYWASYPIGIIAKIGINGGPITTIAQNTSQGLYVAVDSTSIYWTSIWTGTSYGIQKADK